MLPAGENNGQVACCNAIETQCCSSSEGPGRFDSTTALCGHYRHRWDSSSWNLSTIPRIAPALKPALNTAARQH